MGESLILGIETSCDETAAAVYSGNKKLLSSITYTQIALHEQHGGVIPEIASRAQLEKINEVIEQALQKAKVTLDDITAIAVTNKPGLPGSLLVGVCFAKAMAWAKKTHIIGINHIEGHIFSPFLKYDVPFPHICLSASGGHTALYYVQGFGDYSLIGQTKDDAAGEAFDKIAKLMNLGYPGGPIIESLAQKVAFKDTHHYPRGNSTDFDFSFSGLKTAVLYDMVKRNAYDLSQKLFLKPHDEAFKSQVASSLLVCIKDIFARKLLLAQAAHPESKAVTFVGGVACNNYLRGTLSDLASKQGLLFFTPLKPFCTDNAAMIALVGAYKARQGLYSDWNLDILQ